MKIRILKTHQNAIVPTYATEGSACFDLYAATVDGCDINDTCYPGHPVIVGTGLAFEVPDGYALTIRPRSGLAFNYGVQAFQGTIDSDYRGEVIIRMDHGYVDNDSAGVVIRPSDRVAQACLVPMPRVVFEVAEQLSISERGSNGFGSTG